jgi:hypothetical protein
VVHHSRLTSCLGRESSLMAGIYGNSTLTITGPAAGHSEAGFLAREPSKTPFSVDVPYNGPDTMPKDTTITIHLADEKDYSEWDCEPKNVLATRGWVLQDRMLSRRTLYFGSRIMYWECMTGYRREDFHYQINPGLIYGSAVPKISLDKADDVSVRGHWNGIVRTYSNCLLTYKTDKFSALSGIAHAMSKKLHDEYLAGLWRRGIHDGLSWYISRASPDIQMPTADNPFIAPSWSWASVPQNVLFNYHSVGPAVQKQLDVLQADIDSIVATIVTQALDKFGMIRVAKLRMRFAIKKAF